MINEGMTGTDQILKRWAEEVGQIRVAKKKKRRRRRRMSRKRRR
jgi:hypothetical protein